MNGMAEAPGSDAGGLDRVLAERAPLVLRVWERLAADGPGEADVVRAAIAELLAAPGELVPQVDSAPPPLPAGSALVTAARTAYPALVAGLDLLPRAVRELARALGSPLEGRDEARLDAAMERALATAAAAARPDARDPS